MAPVDLTPLKRPLVFAARDGFRQLAAVSGLGDALIGAAQRLAAALPRAAQPTMTGYLAALSGFCQKSAREQRRLVALGLRLCAELEAAGRAQQTAPLTTRANAAPRPKPRPSPAEVIVDLGAPVTVLKGVGPKLAERLAARRLTSVGDLLSFLPRGYHDDRLVTPLTELAKENPEQGDVVRERVTVVGIIARRATGGGRNRRRLDIGLAAVAGEKPGLWCTWFVAPPGLAARFSLGATMRAIGEVRRYQGKLQMVHPEVVVGADATAAGISARYPEIDGVSARALGAIIAQACSRTAHLAVERLPAAVCQAMAFPRVDEALRIVHLVDPPSDAALLQLAAGRHPAQTRFAFEEMFLLQVAAACRRQARAAHRAAPCVLAEGTAQAARDVLPFALTAAQERVVGDILRDMTAPRPMHRLLQGDVGSGKTVVALFAALAAMDSGKCAMLMAPTEILAQQHASVLGPWCERLGRHVALLTARTPNAVRASTFALADGGRVDLLVGTHALLAPRLQVPQLGLVVIDEQHRFGVLQRMALGERRKAGKASTDATPHVLVMTATPIPRSLALTVYGDLDLSVLDEKPPGRQEPVTRVIPGPTLRGDSAAVAEVGGALARGDQVFVVCPLVQASERLAVTDAVSLAARCAKLFPDVAVGMVHGRLPATERDRTLKQFREKKIQILVATTVIEVGIDVAGAQLMVIEHAERFGLAQLHQLRGRVGRRDRAGVCLLLSAAAPGTVAAERLDVLARTSDGFALAEADLTIRGPGELFGTQQAGVELLRFADLRRHLPLLAQAQPLAQRLVAGDPSLRAAEHQAIRAAIATRWDWSLVTGSKAG